MHYRFNVIVSFSYFQQFDRVTVSPCYYGRRLYCSVSIFVLLQSCRVAFDYRDEHCLVSPNALSCYRHCPIAVLSPLPQENHLFTPASYARPVFTAVQNSRPLEMMSPVMFCVLEVPRLYRPKTYLTMLFSCNSILLNRKALRPTLDYQSLKIQYILLSSHNPTSFSINHPCQNPRFCTNIDNGTIPVYQ